MLHFNYVLGLFSHSFKVPTPKSTVLMVWMDLTETETPERYLMEGNDKYGEFRQDSVVLLSSDDYSQTWVGTSGTSYVAENSLVTLHCKDWGEDIG